jgi:ribosomal protein L37AE/L43A
VDRASTTAIAGSNAYNDFLDDELIRQQHEIMGQIKREQEEDFNGTKQQTTSTPGKMMTAKVANEESLWSPTMNTPSSPATRPLPPARTVEPPSEDNYLDQYLDDPTMMLEQQRIMDEILQQQQVTKQDDYVTTTTHEIEHHKKTAVPTSVASIPPSSSRPCSVQMENAPFLFADIQRRPKLSMKSFTSSLTGGQLPSEEDDLVRAYGSQSLRIKGTNHTWKEIEQGQATLVQCPSCSTILQVSRKAKLLYCTKCQEVSPIALYGDNKSTTNDDRIALGL